jgi:phospholipase C
LRHDDLDVVAPADQSRPAQERGVRPARALPYALEAHADVDAAMGTVTIEFDNTGTAAAVFLARSANPMDAPRTYTVEPGKQLRGEWTAPLARSRPTPSRSTAPTVSCARSPVTPPQQASLSTS